MSVASLSQDLYGFAVELRKLAYTMAGQEDLAAVMHVLFGEERKERALAIQRKMAALNSGKRASDSGPVPRMSDASLVPAPPTSSIRLVRDLPPDDERRTAIEGRSSSKPPVSKPPDSDVRARELAILEASRKEEERFARAGWSAAASPRSVTSTPASWAIATIAAIFAFWGLMLPSPPCVGSDA